MLWSDRCGYSVWPLAVIFSFWVHQMTQIAITRHYSTTASHFNLHNVRDLLFLLTYFVYCLVTVLSVISGVNLVYLRFFPLLTMTRLITSAMKLVDWTGEDLIDNIYIISWHLYIDYICFCILTSSLYKNCSYEV